MIPPKVNGDPDVISIEESLPAGSSDCDRSIPFIRVAAHYPGPGGPYVEKGAGALGQGFGVVDVTALLAAF